MENNNAFTLQEIAIIQLALQDQLKQVDDALQTNATEDILNEHGIDRAKILRDTTSSALFKTIAILGSFLPLMDGPMMREEFKKYLK